MSAATRRDRARRSVRTSSSPIAGVDRVADHELELGRSYSPAVRAATQGRGRAGDDRHVDSRLGELHAKVRVR